MFLLYTLKYVIALYNCSYIIYDKIIIYALYCMVSMKDTVHACVFSFWKYEAKHRSLNKLPNNQHGAKFELNRWQVYLQEANVLLEILDDSNTEDRAIFQFQVIRNKNFT